MVSSGSSPLAPPSSGLSPRVVLKFGGTSVSTAEAWKVIAQVTRARVSAGERPMIVHSALSGVTDRLELLPAEALAGRHEPLLAELASRHHALADCKPVRCADGRPHTWWVCPAWRSVALDERRSRMGTQGWLASRHAIQC